ncbi:hypothetical protein [Pseudomonas fluorescens]|uniref:Uncharacterized protein n=1 Tax=Pseudomonas fluorescens TaxID=294 RepID=A0A5E7C9R3_PSEFL|nr:hypothetical protein [Pseudomonas fluorescens]VVO01340.1 hypothetical protein PS691_02655 [Pseudomonas fluorescens]
MTLKNVLNLEHVTNMLLGGGIRRHNKNFKACVRHLSPATTAYLTCFSLPIQTTTREIILNGDEHFSPPYGRAMLHGPFFVTLPMLL